MDNIFFFFFLVVSYKTYLQHEKFPFQSLFTAFLLYVYILNAKHIRIRIKNVLIVLVKELDLNQAFKRVEPNCPGIYDPNTYVDVLHVCMDVWEIADPLNAVRP